jgi:hypothetical protein
VTRHLFRLLLVMLGLIRHVEKLTFITTMVTVRSGLRLVAHSRAQQAQLVQQGQRVLQVLQVQRGSLQLATPHRHHLPVVMLGSTATVEKLTFTTLMAIVRSGCRLVAPLLAPQAQPTATQF